MTACFAPTEADKLNGPKLVFAATNELYERVSRAAESRGTSKSRIIREAVAYALDNME